MYGGEYGELYRLITVVVKGWLAVGLRPHFVFDGKVYYIPAILRGLTSVRLDRSLSSPEVRNRDIADEG